MVKIKFILNGEPVEADVEPNTLLLNLLRDRFGLTGPKYACGVGECGACTVLLDGEPVLSCLTLAVDVNGRRVDTIEGLSDETTERIRRALIEEAGIQCGFCTPGFITTAKWILDTYRNPSIDDIREMLRGNLCRCTGYVNIVRAIHRAAREKNMDDEETAQ